MVEKRVCYYQTPTGKTKKCEYSVTRHFVHYDENGVRVDKLEDEFTPEELKAIKRKLADKFMDSFGYIRVDATKEGTA